MLQPNDCFRGNAHVRNRLQVDEAPRAAGGPFSAQYERLDVAVEELLLLIGERLEFLEHAVELQLVELEAQRFHPIPESVPAAVLT